ncbi:hypothetical protein M569_15089 [Genlisea aurea]|uniref:Uncharacterized protein n=1 Tax=Genlisea aurea TaxID=192259 RepID=S8C5J5_9LAMI|nr:hypothetical protein M569_15089 [Genlisea aurea]
MNPGPVQMRPANFGGDWVDTRMFLLQMPWEQPLQPNKIHEKNSSPKTSIENNILGTVLIGQEIKKIGISN